MRLLVTGASSFVGAHFSQLAARSHDVAALYFSTPIRLNGVSPVRADLRSRRDIRRLQSMNVDAVVHIACKIKATPHEGESSAEAAWRENRALMDGVLSLGRPVLYASSTVVHWSRDTPYAQSRREDEQRLRDSGLPWAVLRPSAPYARALVNHHPAHRESFHTLAALSRRAPVVPVIGNGQYRRQPVHVADFTAAGLSLLAQGLPGAAFDAGGSQALSFNEIIDILGKLAGRRHVPRLHLPKFLFTRIAAFTRDFDPDLIAAIDEDEVADPTALMQATGVRFRPFSEGARDLIS